MARQDGPKRRPQKAAIVQALLMFAVSAAFVWLAFTGDMPRAHTVVAACFALSGIGWLMETRRR